MSLELAAQSILERIKRAWWKAIHNGYDPVQAKLPRQDLAPLEWRLLEAAPPQLRKDRGVTVTFVSGDLPIPVDETSDDMPYLVAVRGREAKRVIV